MTEVTTAKTTIATPLDSSVSARILEEGYGPGAWHGADLRAALADVTAQNAFWRPGAGRHNIAEIALHHAWCVRSVTAQLTGIAGEPFPLEGEDWFDAANERRIAWSEIAAAVESQQNRLASVVAEIGNGRLESPMAEPDRFDLVLGVTCHAIYHAGQIQLLKVLGAAAGRRAL